MKLDEEFVLVGIPQISYRNVILLLHHHDDFPPRWHQNVNVGFQNEERRTYSLNKSTNEEEKGGAAEARPKAYNEASSVRTPPNLDFQGNEQLLVTLEGCTRLFSDDTPRINRSTVPVLSFFYLCYMEMYGAI